MTTWLRGLLLLVAVLLVERHLHRPHKPKPSEYDALVETPDCVPFLDEHLLRP